MTTNRKVIKSYDINKMMYDFCLCGRMWTSYSADKVEVVARYYGRIGKDTHYEYFNPEKEELVFIEATASHIKYSIIERIKIVWRILINS